MPCDYKSEPGIYKIVNPKGAVYIGQSVNVAKRIRQYELLSNCSEQRKIFNSLNKYGVEAHCFSVIQYCDSALLNELEAKYMAQFNARDALTGLNIREAGSRGAHSAETKAKMSQASRGRKMPAWVADAQRKRMSENPINYWLGKERSNEDKAKMSAAHTGVQRPYLFKAITQHDVHGKLIAEYPGTASAAATLGIGRTAIKNNLAGQTKTCSGFIFRFKQNADIV